MSWKGLPAHSLRILEIKAAWGSSDGCTPAGIQMRREKVPWRLATNSS
jgi:hypothetical protein